MRLSRESPPRSTPFHNFPRNGRPPAARPKADTLHFHMCIKFAVVRQGKYCYPTGIDRAFTAHCSPATTNSQGRRSRRRPGLRPREHDEPSVLLSTNRGRT